MRVTLRVADEEYDLYLVRDGDKVKIEIDGQTFDATLREEGGAQVVSIGDASFRIGLAGDDVALIDGRETPFAIEDFRAGGAPGAHEAGGAKGAKVKPPMPGKVVEVRVQAGDVVKPGQVLLILEAMKMQNEIPSPVAGTVKEVLAKTGTSVEAKDTLVIIE